MLVMNRTINDGATVEDIGALRLCCTMLTQDIKISAFCIAPRPTMRQLDSSDYAGWDQWLFRINDGYGDTKLCNIVTVVFYAPELFSRWWGVETSILEWQDSAARLHSFDLITLARRESKGGVGILALPFFAHPLDKFRGATATAFTGIIFFQNEADAVHFSVLTHGERDEPPTP